MAATATQRQEDLPRELCAQLPLAVSVEIFCAETEGGLLQRSSRWPRPDSHESARRLCGRCPALRDCLTAALATDEATFRGLSPEERAVLGGLRGKAAKKRRPYLTVAQVVGRILDSGYDLDEVIGAVADHDARRTTDEPGVVPRGWSVPFHQGRITTEQAVAQLSGHTTTGWPESQPVAS